MMDRQRLKEILIYLGVVILIIAGVFIYFNYWQNRIIMDYNAKIEGLNSQITGEIEKTQTDIVEAKETLSSDINSVKGSLNTLKERNEKEINTLSNLINEIEKQANLKLDKLKSEVKDIQIKSADFSAIVDDVLQSVVSIKANTGQGSGAFIRTGGYIVTNLHVISGASASSITAVTYSNEQYPAQVAGFDAVSDIAVLKIGKNLPYLDFGNSDDAKVGTKVIAAGNPAGLSFTVTEGIVSALRTGSNDLKYLQTDVPINPGNSGGPLINQKGEIIGINNFKYGGFESLGFAIASNEVESVVNSIIGKYEQQLAAQTGQ